MVKRLNFKELKDILKDYKDEDLERISIALPCGTDDGSDGGALGLYIGKILSDKHDANAQEGFKSYGRDVLREVWNRKK